MNRVLLCLLAASVCASAQRPGLLLDESDFSRISDLCRREPWAASVRDGILNAAKAWPSAYLTKYGLKEWVIPPEGGQWTHWYVCPVHGTGLQFRAPDKHVCPTDNKVWTDKKFDQVIYSWRNSDNASAARDLALAWRFTGDAEFARNAGRILLAYAEAYGSWPIHDTNGRIDARTGGRLSAQTLDESVWLIPVAWAYDLIRDSGVLTESQAQTIERDLLRAAAAVIERYNAGRSNWQSWHNGAIGAVAFTLGDDAMASRALDSFRMQMRESVFDDGFWYEGAWSYHFYALDPLWMLAEMASRRGIDLYSEPSLRKMFEAPLKFALPDWTLPAFNDSGSVNLINNARYYEVAWSRYGDPMFLAGVSGRSRGREALFWGAPELPGGFGRAPESEVFLASGYAVLRAGSDHTAILDFGPHGGGHGHYDKLGFISYAREGLLSIDPGTQPYAAPSHTTWDKMTVAHNTIVIDEQVQREAEGKLLGFASSGGMTAARADAGSAWPQATMERTLYLAPEYLVDVAAVRSTDDAEHTFDWIYHNAGTIESPFDTTFTGFGSKNGYQHLTSTRAKETAEDWQVRFDASGSLETAYGSTYNSVSGIKSTATYSREQSASGRFSAKLTYDFTSARGYIVYTSPQVFPVSEKPEGMRLMVYGDGSGNRLSVRIHDATDEKFVKAVGPLDWTGWREVTLDKLEAGSHWGGNADGVLNGPVRAFAIQVDATEGKQAKGELYIDDVSLAYPEVGVNSVIADFERTIRKLRLWMLGGEGTIAVTGEGLGPDLRVPVPFALARRRGKEQRFITLLEPYGDEPGIAGFRVLDDGSLEVTGADFRDVFRMDDSGKLHFTREQR